MFEMDDSEHTAEQPAKWWELLDSTSSFLRFHYDEIMEHGSDELKQAVEIVLGGHPPAAYKKEA
ncbi:hypothetical protein A8709_33090 [Paenibacillus pectinilyticus]|uniref:Uncharacterized protein n=1 Tax=Paenibacillus pectinilyticus TaxID=512399 RepID=A0A1C0ZX85_9BACL|nr:hypothetical protein [Paenibacillus pectinilyticus]OCT12648.1 hypothetical protein A8709_33090 [Paenibacillus pectinilyticus]